jgi:hypothetical protein
VTADADHLACCRCSRSLSFSCPLETATRRILQQTTAYHLPRKPFIPWTFLQVETCGGNREQVAAKRAFSAC